MFFKERWLLCLKQQTINPKLNDFAGI